ncbi:hypothetical protein C0J52_06035 [Blattella germanica]|nr:hypothetical protein C0J52_06035 [Blattella germanica]
MAEDKMEVDWGNDKLQKAQKQIEDSPYDLEAWSLLIREAQGKWIGEMRPLFEKSTPAVNSRDMSKNPHTFKEKTLKTTAQRGLDLATGTNHLNSNVWYCSIATGSLETMKWPTPIQISTSTLNTLPSHAFSFNPKADEMICSSCISRPPTITVSLSSAITNGGLWTPTASKVQPSNLSGKI